MRVITFGSCLSRYTANYYVRLFGGVITSSVYHNRSDAFVGRFIDKDWKIHDPKELSALLKNDSISDIDNKASQILRNQYPEWIGLHRLGKGMPLFQALDEKNVDLFIIDNYMDLAARLVQRTRSKGKDGLFLRLTDFRDPKNKWELGAVPEAEDGVKAMNKIIAFFKKKAPKAQIVFINFPHNTYVDSPKRVERTKEYESLFKLKGGLVIPCLDIHKQMQTDDKQHFKPQQYAGYAGIIYQHLKGKKIIT